MAGGPMMNVFLAVILLGAVFMLFGSQADADRSGLRLRAAGHRRVRGLQARVAPTRRPGRRLPRGRPVVSVDGTRMNSWDQFSAVIRGSADKRSTSWSTATDAGHAARRPDRQHAGRLERPDQTRAGRLPRDLRPTVREPQTPDTCSPRMGSYTSATGEALVTMPEPLWGVARRPSGPSRATRRAR